MNKWLTVVVLVLLVLASAMGLRNLVAKDAPVVVANGGAPVPPAPWMNGGAPVPPAPWMNGGAPVPPAPWSR